MKKNKKIISIILTSLMIFSIVATSLVSTIDSFASSVPFFIAEEYGLSINDILTNSGFASTDFDFSSADLTNIIPNKPYGSAYDYSSRVGEVLNDIQYENTSLNYDSSLFFSVSFANQTLTTFVLPSGSIINTYGYQFDVFIPHDLNITTIYGSRWNCYSNVFDSNETASYDGTVEIDGVVYDYYEWGLTANWSYLYLTNCPLYSVYDIINVRSFGDNQLNYTDSYTDVNVNNGQTSANNLILEDADFTYKHSDYYAPYSSVINTGSVFPNGDIRFSFSPNEYQLEHPSEFKVTLGFTFDYDVNYLLNGNNDNPPFYHKGLTNKKKNCSLRFIYSVGGSEYIDIPLNQFVSNGDIYSISFENVMSHMSGNGYDLSTVLSLSKELDSVEYNKFNINCTAFISSGAQSSGFYTEWYNPINKKGYTTDKSAEVNTNPYYNDSSDSNDVDDSTPLYTPGTAGTGGDNANNVGGGNSNNNISVGGSSSSTGAINITNNNTAYGGSSSSIASGDGSSGFGSFLSTLITLLADGQSSSSETLAEISDSNGWMTIANTSLTAVPTSLWTTLLTTFTVCIAISVVACVISLLLKIFF